MESFPDSPMSPNMVLLLLLLLNFTSFILAIDRRTSCSVNTQEEGCSSQEHSEEDSEEDDKAGEVIVTSEDSSKGSEGTKTANRCGGLKTEGHSWRIQYREL